MYLSITDSLSEVRRYLAATTDPVIVDIETTSLSVANGQLLCVGLGPLNQEDVLVWWPRSPEDLARLRVPKMVAHNSPFESRWLQHYGARVATHWDTMFMAHLLDENHSIGLKELGQRLLGYEDWSDSNVAALGTEFGQKWADRASIDPKRWRQSKRRVSRYNAADVHITRELMRWQQARIAQGLAPGADPVRVMQDVMLWASPALVQMEDNRLPVRLPRVRATKARVEKEIARIERHLDASIPPVDVWPDWLKKTKPKWGSTNWTKWWLYVYQGALCPRRTKPTKTWPEGNPGLSQEDLAKIDHPAAKMLSRRSTLYKQLTGFLNPIELRTTNGRISTSFLLTGTVTGRLSSRSPSKEDPGLNSQQIPRDRATRTLFGERGHAWIEVDFSQLELRVAAVLANEPTMLQLFADGEDIHKFTGTRLVKADTLTKEQRSLAKGVNFGFLYGMQATHFGNYVQDNYGLKVTKKEGEAFREEFFTLFSALPVWYRKQRAEAIEYGGVHNEFGRFRHLPRVYNEDYWVQENAFRQAVNSPVQSTGSDFMLVSLGRLARDLRLPELGARLVGTVHDSVCLTAPYSTARRVGRIVKTTMEQADDILDRKFFLKADVTISRCWGGEPLAEF